MNKEESLHCSKSCENQMFDGQKRRDEAWVCVSDSEIKREWQMEREEREKEIGTHPVKRRQ